MRLLSVWKHCFGSGFLEHEGRADREEFWLFSLLALPLAVLLVWLMLALDQMFPGLWAQPLPAGEEIPRLLLRLLLVIIWLGLLTPAVCVTIRRLHDMDASGRWVIAALVPGLAALCCWLLTSWQLVDAELPRMVLNICAGGLAVLEALAVVTLGPGLPGRRDAREQPFRAGPAGAACRSICRRRTPTASPWIWKTTRRKRSSIWMMWRRPNGTTCPAWSWTRRPKTTCTPACWPAKPRLPYRMWVKVGGAERTAPQAEGPTPTEAFAQMVAQALQKTAAGAAVAAGAQAAAAPAAPAAPIPPANRGRGDWPPADMTSEEMSLASHSLQDLAAQVDTAEDEELVDSLLEEMEQAEDARREADCIRPGQTVTQAMQRLEANEAGPAKPKR